MSDFLRDLKALTLAAAREAGVDRVIAAKIAARVANDVATHYAGDRPYVGATAAAREARLARDFAIRRAYHAGESQTALARHHGLSKGRICQIIGGEAGVPPLPPYERIIAVEVPANHLLPGACWTQPGRPETAPERSYVNIELHAGADAFRFELAASNATGDLAAALLLKRQAESAAAAGAPWVEPSLRMINDASIEAESLRRAHLKAQSGRVQHGAALETAGKRNAKRFAAKADLAPYFEAAHKALRLTKSGAARKRISNEKLAETALAHAIRAGKSLEWRAMITSASAATWRADNNL